MKQTIHLAITVSLAIAVGVLYYLKFASSSAISDGDGPFVAYVNMDTLARKYDFIKAEDEKLKAIQAQLSMELDKKQREFQAEVDKYRSKESSMTMQQMQDAQTRLGRQNELLQAENQNAQEILYGEQQKIGQQLSAKLTGYLKDFASKKGIQIVFQYSQGSGILYGSEPMDITKDVVEGLNQAYKKESEQAKAPVAPAAPAAPAVPGKK